MGHEHVEEGYVGYTSGGKRFVGRMDGRTLDRSSTLHGKLWNDI